MFETQEMIRNGRVATLWMNRPERHNASMRRWIAEWNTWR
jgi:hypothetical protein